MAMQAMSDEVVCVTVYRHCLYLGNPTHSYRNSGSHSSLCMQEYTNKEKEMAFPALQYVYLHMQTLVWLPLLYLFTCVNVGYLKVITYSYNSQ
jgi:hypothetical protein